MLVCYLFELEDYLHLNVIPVLGQDSGSEAVGNLGVGFIAVKLVSTVIEP
jgi:hypothetical protein